MHNFVRRIQTSSFSDYCRDKYHFHPRIRQPNLIMIFELKRHIIDKAILILLHPWYNSLYKFTSAQLQLNRHPRSASSYLQPQAVLCHPHLEIQDLVPQLNEAHYVYQLSVVGLPKEQFDFH